MRALGVVVFVALAAASFASPAEAYRPPARVLLQKAMDRQVARATRSLRVEMETQSFDVRGMPTGAPVTERLLFQAPGNLRRESEHPDGLHVETRVNDKVMVRAPGEPDRAQRAPIDLLTDVVTAAPPLSDKQAADRFLRNMRALGVNPEVVSFARFDGRVAYLIGAKPWQDDKPQVWLDKDSLLLLRVVMLNKGEGGATRKVDVRYLGWGSPVGGVWFPQTIEVWSDGKLARRSIVKTVDRNVPVDATLFK